MFAPVRFYGLKTMEAFAYPVTLAQSTSTITVLAVIIGAAVGVLFGFWLMRWLGRTRLETARAKVEQMISEAQTEAEVTRKTATIDAKAEYLKGQEQLRKESTDMRAELKEIEKRLAKREDNIEGKLDTLSTKERKLEQDRSKLDNRLEQVKKREQDAVALISERREQLLKVAGLTIDQAKQTILSELKQELEHESAELIERATASAGMRPSSALGKSP